MTAYFIVYQNVTDLDQYTQYLNAVVPVIERRSGRFIAQGTPEVMEGTLPWQRSVVLEWQSHQDFLDFWESEEYAEIKKLREGAAEWQAVVVEGIHPSNSMARLTTYHTIEVEGLNIFYREAGAKEHPTIVLLHGFPSSSHMYRDLMNKLSAQFHVIAPDYPGFGNSDTPPIAQFEYSFDHLSGVIESFLQKLRLDRFSLYVQDYGAPIGFRIATRHPEWIQALIVQNGNAYNEGLREFWEPLKAYWRLPSTENTDKLRPFLTLETTKWQYTHGVRNPEAISPDNWNMDQRFLDRPGNDEIQLALFYSYRSNPPLYPQWQEYFRQYQPPTLIVWGKNDYIFPVEGAYPYRHDLKDVELHLLDTGHFALEEECDAIASHITRFISTHTR